MLTTHYFRIIFFHPQRLIELDLPIQERLQPPQPDPRQRLLSLALGSEHQRPPVASPHGYTSVGQPVDKQAILLLMSRQIIALLLHGDTLQFTGYSWQAQITIYRW